MRHVSTIQTQLALIIIVDGIQLMYIQQAMTMILVESCSVSHTNNYPRRYRYTSTHIKKLFLPDYKSWNEVFIYVGHDLSLMPLFNLHSRNIVDLIRYCILKGVRKEEGGARREEGAGRREEEG